MNKKGQVGDLIEFKVSMIILLVLIVLAFIIFHIPSYGALIFGEVSAYSPKAGDLVYEVQKDSLYDLVFINYLNDDSSIGNVADLISSQDTKSIENELLVYKPLGFRIQYFDGEVIDFRIDPPENFRNDAPSLLHLGAHLSDMEGERILIYLVEVDDE